jgi:hypothetical protein
VEVGRRELMSDGYGEGKVSHTRLDRAKKMGGGGTGMWRHGVM